MTTPGTPAPPGPHHGDATTGPRGARGPHCPRCGGALIVAPHDPAVPTYPTYSDIAPVAERWCQHCHAAWVYEDGETLVRIGTALAQALHDLAAARRREEATNAVVHAAEHWGAADRRVRELSAALRDWPGYGREWQPLVDARHRAFDVRDAALAALRAALDTTEGRDGIDAA